MNSRHANFYESLKEVIGATATEAAAVQENVTQQQQPLAAPYPDPEPESEISFRNRKKRKTIDDDA